MWYAIYTRARKEASASRYLAMAGVEVVCPTTVQLKRVRRRGRYVMVDQVSPVFPSYLFARVGNAIYSLIADPPDSVGRLSLVSAGHEPLPIPDEVVEELRDVGAKMKDSEMAIGRKVRLDGLAGLLVSISAVASDRREVSVWLEMFGVRKEVTVPMESISLG